VILEGYSGQTKVVRAWNSSLGFPVKVRSVIYMGRTVEVLTVEDSGEE
jgi:ABC-type hemin transport system ATPase subunit